MSPPNDHGDFREYLDNFCLIYSKQSTRVIILFFYHNFNFLKLNKFDRFLKSWQSVRAGGNPLVVNVLRKSSTKIAVTKVKDGH